MLKESEDLYNLAWARYFEYSRKIHNSTNSLRNSLNRFTPLMVKGNEEWIESNFDKFIVDGIISNDINKDEFITKMAVGTTEISNKDSYSFINASSIIFSHSLFDDILSIILRIIEIENNSVFFIYVKNRKVGLEDLKKNNSEELINNLIHEYVISLKKESIKVKIEKIFASLKLDQIPRSESYLFNLNLIKEYDGIRHVLVHDKLIYIDDNQANSIVDYFLKSTVFFLMRLHDKYSFTIDINKFTGFLKPKANTNV